MTQWKPEWSLTIDGGLNYTNLTLANLTISSGRTDIYSQPRSGFATIEIINLDLSPIVVDVNDSVTLKIKDSTGTYVNLFGGYITDIDVVVDSTGTGGINERIKIMALGTLSKLPKTLTDGVLSKDYDGNQIYSILLDTFFNNWSETPGALTWADYDPTVEWSQAENTGLGQIDTPGNYELTDRSASTTDMYSLISGLATSGLGYIYEDASGRICYADSTHRKNYIAANSYTYLSGNQALIQGMRTIKRIADIRNKVTISYKNGQKATATDATSIATYGSQAQEISTSIEQGTAAQDQADFYLLIRSWPRTIFDSISFSLTNPELDDADRDALLNVFMGLPLIIENLPVNMVNGRFQGFVEGWTFRAGYNSLSLTMNVSPIALSVESEQWNNMSVTETWDTINSALQWVDATIVA